MLHHTMPNPTSEAVAYGGCSEGAVVTKATDGRSAEAVSSVGDAARTVVRIVTDGVSAGAVAYIGHSDSKEVNNAAYGSHAEAVASVRYVSAAVVTNVADGSPAEAATLTTKGPACRHWDLISCRIGPSCRDFTGQKSRCCSRRVGLSPATWRSSADLVA